MDTNHPGDALATGLLLLQGSNDSNNDREDCSRTSTTNDSDVAPASNNIGPTPTSNDSMDVSPASPVVETKPKRRKYTKRGGTSFIQKMGSMKAKYTYQATNPIRPNRVPMLQSQHCRRTLPAIKLWLSLTLKRNKSLFTSTTSKLVHLHQKTGVAKAGQYQG